MTKITHQYEPHDADDFMMRDFWVMAGTIGSVLLLLFLAAFARC